MAGFSIFYFNKNHNLNNLVEKQNTNYSLKIFKADEGGWGYNIQAGKKVIVHQDIIPVFPNTRAFKTKVDAIKVGKAVLNKCKKNQLPTISIEELDSLNITQARTMN